MARPLGRLFRMSAENSEESQSGAIDRGQVLLIALVALALIASVIMLITDSNSALKLALLAALWAAIIGFFLVFRYRRQAEQSQEQLVHERELHEATTAKAEAERTAEIEKLAREQQEKERSEEAETLVKIQEELAELRANLEAMSGRDLGYEPAALRAQARRIMELEAEAGNTGQSPHVKGAPSTAAVSGLLGQTPKEPMRREPLVDEDDDVPSLVDNDGAEQDAEEATASPAAPEPAKAAADGGTADQNARTRVFNTGSFTSVKWDETGSRHVADATPSATPGKTTGKAAEEPAVPEQAKKEPAKADPAPAAASSAELTEEELAEQRRGRRRRDERKDSVSVADLMASFRKDQE